MELSSLTHPGCGALQGYWQKWELCDFENTTSWFIQNGMKPNPDKYQATVLGNWTLN